MLGHCPGSGLDSPLEVLMFHLGGGESLSIYKRKETFPVFIQKVPSCAFKC